MLTLTTAIYPIKGALWALAKTSAEKSVKYRFGGLGYLLSLEEIASQV